MFIFRYHGTTFRESRKRKGLATGSFMLSSGVKISKQNLRTRRALTQTKVNFAFV